VLDVSLEGNLQPRVITAPNSGEGQAVPLDSAPPPAAVSVDPERTQRELLFIDQQFPPDQESLSKQCIASVLKKALRKLIPHNQYTAAQT
jgi:hypothetical protein